MIKTIVLGMFAGLAMVVFDYFLIVVYIKLIVPKLKPIVINLPNPIKVIAVFTVIFLIFSFWTFVFYFFLWDFHKIFEGIFPKFLSTTSESLNGIGMQDIRFKIVASFQICLAGVFVVIEMVKQRRNKKAAKS